ncbi:MAG: protein kinase [bacterium]
MFDLTQKYDAQVVDLLKTLGRAYLESGESQKACEKYKQLVNQGIEEPEILRNYALALARMQSINDEALHIYKQAVANEPNDEVLYLTLSTLFLKQNIKDALALKVYRGSLKFAPPFEEEIRTALEKIFHEPSENISIPELRQAFLDAQKNPELLYLYLFTAWQQEKYDQALHILKDLYLQTDRNAIYLDAICQTLFERKSKAEEKGLKFTLSFSEVRHCLKYRNIGEPFRRIRDIEFYLDFKNLCSALPKNSKDITANNHEYEFFVADNALENIEEIADTHAVVVEVDPSFNLVHDFIDKFSYRKPNIPQLCSGANNNQLTNSNKIKFVNQSNTIAIIEITNIDKSSKPTKLPFANSLQLISKEIAGLGDLVLCRTEDGLITFFTNPKEMVHAAVHILKQLERHNQVVEASERIGLRVTIHSTIEPLINFPNQGLKEIRKAFKIHNIDLKGRPSFAIDSMKGVAEANLLLISEPVASCVAGSSLKNLGEFRLPHLPSKHTIYEVVWQDTITALTKRFGRFEVSETIKEDQLYATFRGLDPHLDRPVIIKAYKTHAFSSFKNFTQLRKQFYVEVRRQNRIAHPNVAVIYDAGEEGDLLYFVREFITGTDLNDYLTRQGLPDINTTLELYLQISKILTDYHQSQILHKNLKPNNVILTQQNDIKLADAGLLQLFHTDTIWQDDIDSQSYVSPEQIQGLRLTQSCDVFLLAIMLYESLTGRHPFWPDNTSDARTKILADNPPPPSNLRFEIPKELDGILSKALAKSPEHRYQSIDEFASALRAVHGEQQITKVKGMLEMN